jgi:hypothetical protein
MPPGAYPTITERPPRPKSPTGSLLLIGGAALHIGCGFMPWYTRDGETLTGMDTFVREFGTDTFESPGIAFVAMGIIVGGLGIAAYFAGRQIALAIVTLVMTVLALFVSFIGIAVADDQKKFDELFAESGDVGSAGIGVVLGILSMLVCVAGAIVVLAKRRRPAAQPTPW